MDIFWVLVENITNIIQAVYTCGFVLLMLEYKELRVNKYMVLAMAVICDYLAITAINNITVFEGIGIFIYVIIYAIFAFPFFKDSLLKKIIISVIPVNVLATGSLIAGNIISFVSNEPVLELMSESSIYRLMGIIIANLFPVLILLTIWLISRKSNIELGNKEWLFMGIILTLTVFTFNMIYNLAFEAQSRLSKLYIALAVLGLVLMNIINYVLMTFLANRHQLAIANERLSQALTYQEETAKEVKSQYEQLHKVRHDFKSVLELIKAISETGDCASINEYINEYQASWDEIIQIVHTDNDYVNAIINAKVTVAKNSGITVFTNTVNKIGNSASLALSSIIGNMFDNAIEACSKCVGTKRINFEISRSDATLELLLKNTINESVLESNPLLMSTKNDKKNHGYGTKIIRELAEKCNGYADFYEKDGMFCCHVIVKA